MYFQYDITWTEPNYTWSYTTDHYQVQTFAFHDINHSQFCSCKTFPETTFSFKDGCTGFSSSHTLYYKVAAHTSVGLSDFTYGNKITVEAGECK